jgi:hypothetical protein
VRHEIARKRTGHRGDVMNDFVFVSLSVAFFAACVAYAYFCEKVR